MSRISGKVFVAGHQGMVGSALLRQLQERDELQLLVGTGTLTAEACSAMMYIIYQNVHCSAMMSDLYSGIHMGDQLYSSRV